MSLFSSPEGKETLPVSHSMCGPQTNTTGELSEMKNSDATPDLLNYDLHFPQRLAHLTLHQKSLRVPISLHPRPYLLFSCFLNPSRASGCKMVSWEFDLHVFSDECPLASCHVLVSVCISSSRKCPFRSVALFKTWVVFVVGCC